MEKRDSLTNKRNNNVRFLSKEYQQVSFKNGSGNAEFPDEKVLWEAFCNGSTRAFGIIYNQYVQHLFRYGCQLTNDRELIQDAIHALFLDLRAREAKPPVIISIKSYLIKAFYRTLLRMLKKESRFSRLVGNVHEIDLTLSINPDTSMVGQGFTIKQQKTLEVALNKLPKKQKEALNYYFYEGMDYEEIAFIMEMKRVHSARKLIYKALNYLRTALDDKHNTTNLSGFLLMALLPMSTFPTEVVHL